MNNKEKRIYDDIIKTLKNYSNNNNMWEYILEDLDGDYNIALFMTMELLDIIIDYEKGKKEIDEKMIGDYIECYRLLYDLKNSIYLDNYLNIEMSIIDLLKSEY